MIPGELRFVERLRKAEALTMLDSLRGEAQDAYRVADVARISRAGIVLERIEMEIRTRVAQERGAYGGREPV
jgi:hypothetical protein